MDFFASLTLGEKVFPHRNPGVAWFWIFLPALLAYLSLLMQSLNGKPFIGSIEVYDGDFEKIVALKYPIEVIATGMKRGDGPMWVDNDDSLPYLLYSDTVQNSIFKWEEGKGFFTVGKTLYLPKSGCRAKESKLDGEICSDGDGESNHTLSEAILASEKYCGSLREPGSSGLARVYAPTLEAGESAPLDMLVCQHGMRSIVLQRDNGTRTVIVSHYKGKRLNSPADMAWSPEGHLYFTDPTFGLAAASTSDIRTSERGNSNTTQELRKTQEHSRDQEQPVRGVYMVHSNDIAKAIRTGEPAKNVFLIDGKMSQPKGLAFSPGYSRLYVSNADRMNAYWKVFDVNSAGLAHKGRVFYNATAAEEGIATSVRGKPGGIKTDIMGNVYATGPGGLFVLDAQAKMLAKFNLDREATGVAFGTDGRLYITTEDALLRKWMKTRPPNPPSSAMK